MCHTNIEDMAMGKKEHLDLRQFTQTSYGAEREKGSSFHCGNPTSTKTYLRTVAAVVVETVQAPPAIVFLHAEQCQIPTAVLLTES
jgi:hypothetical protein